MIGEYHEEQLRLLLEHVRDGFDKLDRGELDPFELDELIHRYKRSAQTGARKVRCSITAPRRR